MKIEVRARKIKDSRNQDTIEVSVNGCRASAPEGKSTGKYETPPYHKSLDWNIKSLNSLKINFEINSFSDLKKLENAVKTSFHLKDAKQFGANALFALESAVLKALAKSKKKQLWQIINEKAGKMPVPVGNAIGGGKHSHNSNHPSFQEFLLIPKEKSIKENYALMQKTYKEIKKELNSNSKNDEGAWQTALDEESILQILSKNKNIKIGIDVAASSFYKNGIYNYRTLKLNRQEQIEHINFLIDKYNLFYIEDPLHEEDFEGFAVITKSKNNLVVGDDLTATHLDRLKQAIKTKSINAIIIKPNQNGSLIELAEIFKICRSNNIKTVISHRSGETLDNALADFAFGFQADFIKCGISTKWREVKLKRLIEIERSLKK